MLFAGKRAIDQLELKHFYLCRKAFSGSDQKQELTLTPTPVYSRPA